MHLPADLPPKKRPDRDSFVTIIPQHLHGNCLLSMKKMTDKPETHQSKGFITTLNLFFLPKTVIQIQYKFLYI